MVLKYKGVDAFSGFKPSYCALDLVDNSKGLGSIPDRDTLGHRHPQFIIPDTSKRTVQFIGSSYFYRLNQ